MQGDDIAYIRKMTLDVHEMVHPAEVSGKTEKTIADYVLDYMMHLPPCLNNLPILA